ncbi:MAG: site-specific integrase [Lachnospiraceae bacterium]|nr:site-specific integrase [Lachnospiraceae bacterium]
MVISIANRDIRTLKTRDIKLWLLDITHSNNLDRKKYKEMKSVINMMLDYAVEDGTIVHNAAREIKNISDKHFNEPEAEDYVKKIIKHNKSIDPESEWLFLSLDGKQLTKDSINNVLRRVNKKLDIIQQGNHSIRKTVLTSLFKYGFMEEEVRKFGGQKNASTTHTYYEFANPDDQKDVSRYSKALHINSSPKTKP